MKSKIITELGQGDILLPSLVAEGLAANDRIKVHMSALQAAVEHAQQPDHPATDLSVECRAAGIAPAELAALIAERAIFDLHGPVLRVTGYDVPYPYWSIEDAYMPSVERVAAAVRSLF